MRSRSRAAEGTPDPGTAGRSATPTPARSCSAGPSCRGCSAASRACGPRAWSGSSPPARAWCHAGARPAGGLGSGLQGAAYLPGPAAAPADCGRPPAPAGGADPGRRARTPRWPPRSGPGERGPHAEGARSRPRTSCGIGSDDEDMVGARVLVGMQMIDISRLSAHPVPMVVRRPDHRGRAGPEGLQRRGQVLLHRRDQPAARRRAVALAQRRAGRGGAAVHRRTGGPGGPLGQRRPRLRHRRVRRPGRRHRRGARPAR